MGEFELQASLNVWKASITNMQRRESQNIDAFERNVETKIASNHPPATVPELEKYTMSAMKLKTYGRIIKEIDVLISYLGDICEKNFPPNAVESAKYLTACTILDEFDMSKDAMKKIIKKMDIREPITDHATLITYGKLRPSQEDVINETQRLIEKENDEKKLLLAVLMSSDKYKAKIILIQQIKKNSNNPNNSLPSQGNTDYFY